MKALITGGLGFMGSNLAHKLLEKGHEITLIDALIPGLGGNEFNIGDIKDKVKVIKDDIRKESVIKDVVKDKDIIFHLAGQVDHKRSIEKPFEDVNIRVNGTLSLLEACKKHNPDVKIVFSSTRAVYGVSKIPVNEESSTNPKGMYAITSLTAEKILAMYRELYGIKSTILRFTNSYGPRHQMKEKYGIANYFIKLALAEKPITVMGTGKVLRDYIFVDDCNDAFIICAENSKTDGQILNIGTGKGISFLELANEIKAQTNAEIEMIDYPKDTKLLEPGDFVANISKMKTLTGWEPKTDIKQGIKATLDFYKEFGKNYW